MDILVTGGTSGLGEQIVLKAGELGHNVWTLSKDSNADIQLDLSDTLDNVTGAFLKKSDFETIIHCAGVNLLKPHDDITDADMVKLFRVNALATFFLTRLFQPFTVCSVISDAAWTPMTHSIAYNVSKAAQLMVVRQMAHENKDVNIFGVAPGKIKDTGMSNYIDTTFPPMRAMSYDEGREYQLKGLKTGEIAPWDLAGFIMSLVEMDSPHFRGHIFTYGG